MSKPIMNVMGMDGRIELLPDRVVIHRDGVFNMFKYGLNSTREIPLMAISEVAFKQPTPITFGSIDFVRSGRSQDEKSQKNFSAVKFKKKDLPQFVKLKEKVFELLQQMSHQRP